MKKDIGSREDIELLMKTFYDHLLSDERISYIFTDVAKIDIEKHLPIIVDFWETVILHKNVYHNNTMKIHLDLHKKSVLSKEHFEVWLSHFNTSVDELFEGTNALLAKQRAKSVATVMQIKIAQKPML
jgi:hemoglobin